MKACRAGTRQRSCGTEHGEYVLGEIFRRYRQHPGRHPSHLMDRPRVDDVAPATNLRPVEEDHHDEAEGHRIREVLGLASLSPVREIRHASLPSRYR